MFTIQTLLKCTTSSEWLEAATKNIDLLLTDQLHNEKKAATTAISLLEQRFDKPFLLKKLSCLAREELIHFEKVLQFIKQRQFAFIPLPPCSYAKELRKLIAQHQPERFIDILIVSAFIEARGCERFIALLPYVDSELRNFYQEFIDAEKRHFHDYLTLAEQYTSNSIAQRILLFADFEAQLISRKDQSFRFFSGIPY